MPIPTPEFVHSCIEQYITDRFTQPRKNYWLAICHLKTPTRCIGLVSLRGVELEHGTAEIGYSVHHDEAGQGIATEAVQRIIEFGIHELHLGRFIARTAEPNHGSRRVLAKLGFREVGSITNPRPIRGDVIPALLLELSPTSSSAQSAQCPGSAEPIDPLKAH